MLGQSMAAGAVIADALRAGRDREDARRLAQWDAFNSALRDGRESALRGALEAAMIGMRARDARIAELEVAVEELEDEVDELLEG